MKAVILAAGKGTRLGDLTKSLPKCLLKIGHRTIIETQMEILNQYGIKDITVVIGHKGDLVRSILKDRAIYVVNDIYDQSNSSYSLYLARKGLGSGWLHMNCDLLFSPAILEKVLRTENDNSIVVDLHVKPTDDAEKVRIEKGMVVEMSKIMPHDKAQGKITGMARFSADGARAVLDHLDRVINSGDRSRWFFSIIADVIDQVPFKAVTTDGEFWAEIDTQEDLEHARKVLGESAYY